MKPYLLLLRLHQRLYQSSRGWLGHRLLGVPTLLLRTRGRRTGHERTSALVYARTRAEYAVVASNGGSETAPGWLFNIRADASVAVQIGRQRFGATARVVTPDHDEYEDWFARCDKVNRGRFAGYQRRTNRPIPVVVLTPVKSRG